MATYAKSSPKTVNPRDIAGERRRRISSSSPLPLAPVGAWTTYKSSPGILILGKPLKLSPDVTRPLCFSHRLGGLVVKASASRAEGPGFESRLRRDFSGSSHTSDLKIGTPVATLPGVWRYRVSTGTGRPGVSILWLGEVESLICSFYLSVAARKIVWADPSPRYTRLLLGR